MYRIIVDQLLQTMLRVPKLFGEDIVRWVCDIQLVYMFSMLKSKKFR